MSRSTRMQRDRIKARIRGCVLNSKRCEIAFREAKGMPSQQWKKWSRWKYTTCQLHHWNRRQRLLLWFVDWSPCFLFAQSEFKANHVKFTRQRAGQWQVGFGQRIKCIQIPIARHRPYLAFKQFSIIWCSIIGIAAPAETLRSEYQWLRFLSNGS